MGVCGSAHKTLVHCESKAYRFMGVALGFIAFSAQQQAIEGCSYRTRCHRSSCSTFSRAGDRRETRCSGSVGPKDRKDMQHQEGESRHLQLELDQSVPSKCRL